MIHEAEHTVLSFVIYGSEQQLAVEELLKKEDFERQGLMKFTCNRGIDHICEFFEKGDEKMANWEKGLSTKACRRPLGYSNYAKSEFDDLNVKIDGSRFYSFNKRVENVMEVFEYAETLQDDLTETEYNK